MTKTWRNSIQAIPTPNQDQWLYSDRFVRALAAAAQMHAAQVRKATTIPYVSHLLGTCAIALEYGADEDEAIAALLHDAIEDVEPIDDARAAVASFGDRVLEIVMGCSDFDVQPEAAVAGAQGCVHRALGRGRQVGRARLGLRQAAQRALDPQRPPSRSAMKSGTDSTRHAKSRSATTGPWSRASAPIRGTDARAGRRARSNSHRHRRILIRRPVIATRCCRIRAAE